MCRYTKLMSLILGVFLLTATSVYASKYQSHLDGKDVFVTQYNTGTYASYNCAPTSVAMIEKWLGREVQSISSIRNQISSSQSWIYTDEVEVYLQKQDIKYQKRYLWQPEDLIAYLEEGMLILCIDISRISRRTSSDTFIGKTSSGGTGHFILASGYAESEAGTYIEVLDPLNSEVRYYPIDELLSASQSWWSQAFVVGQ